MGPQPHWFARQGLPLAILERPGSLPDHFFLGVGGVLLEQAAAHLGVPSSEITRDVIAEHCDAPLGEALARAAEELRVLVVELDAVVARNAAMMLVRWRKF